MSVSVLTFLLLVIVLCAVAVGALRGRHRNAPEALIRLGVLVLCAVIAAAAAPALARVLLPGAVTKLDALLKLKGAYTGYPHFTDLVRSVTFGLVSPGVCLLLFLLLWAVGSGILSACVKPRGSSRRERARARAERRAEDKQEAWCGALVGALAGLAFCVCVTAPVMGTLRLTEDAVDKLTALPGVTSKMLKPKAREELSLYAHDPVGSALYACGGQLIYEASARAEINGDGYGLVRELDRATSILGRAETMIPDAVSAGNPGADTYDKLHALVDELEASPAARTLMADYVAVEAPGLADKYAEEAKSGNGIAVSLVDIMMQKCARTTYDTVCPDMHSVIDVLSILGTHNINSLPYEEAVALLSESGIMDNIYTVMMDAPSLLSAAESLNYLASDAFFKAALDRELSDPALYNAFIDDLVGTFEQTQYYSDERRLTTIRGCVSDYADMMKLNASDDIKDAVSYSIMSEFSSRETLTREDVVDIFNSVKRMSEQK